MSRDARKVLTVALWLSMQSAFCLCEVSSELHLGSLRLELSHSLYILIDTCLCEVQLFMSSVDFCLKVYKLMLKVCHTCPFLSLLTE